MERNEAESASNSKVDVAAYFDKLGLKPADARPILESFRQANAAWRRQRQERLIDHAQRIQDHLRRFQRPQPRRSVPAPPRKGKNRPVWCVELRRHFPTLTEAAHFVNRKASNISQSLRRGVRCGPYHWEEFDPSSARQRKT